MYSLQPSPDGASSGRKLLFRAAHVVVPVVLIVLVVRAVGAEEVVSRLGSVAPGWIVATFLAAQAQIVLCAVRWRLTAAQLGAELPYDRAVAEYYLSGAINMTLPGGVLGDAARAVRTRGEAGFEVAAHAVVIERLAGQVALGAVLILGLLLSGIAELRWAAFLALAALAVLGGCTPILRRSFPRRWIPGTASRFAAAIRSSWFDRRVVAAQIVLSLMIVAANLAAFAFASAATGTTIGVIESFFAVPLILVAMLIPFSVAGWGYREGAAAAVFPLIGASAAAGVGASVVFGAVILLANLPGIAVLLVRGRQGPDAPPVGHEPAE